MTFYAYIHCKPDGTPFYVGKGNKARLKRLERPSNDGHNTILAAFGRDNILVGSFECSTEEISFDLERGLIKKLRKMGFDIVNLTDGGGGASGFKMPEKAKEKIRDALTGRAFSPAHLRNLKKALQGRPMPPISATHKAAIGASNAIKKIGNQNTLGRLWATNGVTNKMVTAHWVMPDGWGYGMSRAKKS
jgi:hypothetical protein